MSRTLNWMPRSNRRLVALVGVTTFVCALAYGIASGVRPPRVADEFSYLLGAETFASGRLTNPTHPFWRHFETYHVLARPTYMSLYPPGQAIFLALGMLLGQPAVGVWLSVATMAAATCWMLLAWTTRRWAIIGAWALVISFGVDGYWAQAYWGGAVAATGGALLFGALRRMLRRTRVSDGVIMGAGLILLANTRPYEGLGLALGAGAILLWAEIRRVQDIRRRIRQTYAPIAGMLLIAGTLMGFYNNTVTGNWTQLPYLRYHDEMDPRPLFIFQPAREVRDDLPPRRDRYQEIQVRDYMREGPMTLRTMGKHVGDVTRTFRRFYVSPVMLSALLLTLPWLICCRRTRVALVLVSGMLAAECLVPYYEPHYSAGATSLIVFLSVEAFRRLSVVATRSRLGGRTAPMWILLVLLVAVRTNTVEARFDFGAVYRRSVPGPSVFPYDRLSVVRQLEDIPGDHLVFVSYRSDYSLHSEWVYNAAELDKARIVWAHDLGPEANSGLMEYFSDRTTWSVRVGPGESDLSGPPQR